MPFRLSYSSLKAFQTCAKQFYHLKVARDVEPFPAGKAALDGTKYHTALELCIQQQSTKPAPVHLKRYARLLLDEYEQKHHYTLYPEYKIRRDDPSFVGIIDLIAISPCGTKAEIIDHKFGKNKTDETQILTQCWLAHKEFPDIKHFFAGYYWHIDRQIEVHSWSVEDVYATIERQIKPEMAIVIKAVEDRNEQDFKPNPSGLCRAWCPVTTCVHNGQYQYTKDTK